ncbi:type II toxin-antitoxin system Phd/YefM family antitoxin [Planktothrix paucivesiculata]|uniref:Prevent-host-death family protein n=1 Tax=Planktothrix paucivesiculata PCC 9631 TaxID=671071 RepID=A0A7Z9BKE2_9CYAN|nr:type II toxin-antitoxin system Phd/YefM family antitoxin [Planktothrix paucivesiculata]VXD12825.1 putative Prevent-host-death family protein [Planktothrix paucivesiculata PCC 9631]
MKYLNIQEIDLSLNAIVDEVTTNQSEVVITRDGLPIVRIVPCQTTPITKHYPLRGKAITIASDFDEPMPKLWEALGE